MYRSTVLFKAFFLVNKKKSKSSQALHRIFSNPPCKCSEVSQSPISKSTPLFSIAPSILKNMLTQWSESTNGINKYSVNYHSSPSRLKSTISSHGYLYIFIALYLSPEYLSNFLSNFYIQQVGENAQIHVQITIKNVGESENRVQTFPTSCCNKSHHF